MHRNFRCTKNVINMLLFFKPGGGGVVPGDPKIGVDFFISPKKDMGHYQHRHGGGVCGEIQTKKFDDRGRTGPGTDKPDKGAKTVQGGGRGVC